MNEHIKLSSSTYFINIYEQCIQIKKYEENILINENVENNCN